MKAQAFVIPTEEFMQPTQEQLITLQDLATHLQVSDRTVYDMVKNSEIPFIRLGKGGDYRFNKQAVLDTLSSISAK